MELIAFIEKYWTIVVAFAGIVVSYTTLKIQNNDQEKRICHLETKQELNEGVVLAIKVALAEIQLDLKWIKQSLNKDK